MKSLSKNNVVFLCLVLTIFLISNGLLMYDLYFTKIIQTGEPVGTVIYKNRDAEQKAYGSALWNTITLNDPIYNQETIRTASQSSALIRLSNNSEISLNEESLVFINYEKDATKINIIEGSIVVDNRAKAVPVLVKTRSGTVSLKDGRVQIRDTETGVQVQLENGNATIKQETSNIQLTQNAEYNISTAERTEFDVELKYPKQDQIIITKDNNEKIPFSWEFTGTHRSSVAPPVLTVAQDALFKNIEFTQESSANSLIATVSEGLHYWKLLPKSPIQWFTVIKMQLPVLLSPRDQIITFFEKPPLISFVWSKQDLALLYRLEIYNKNKSDSPVFSNTLTESILSIDTLETGDYIWRITALFGTDKTEIVSDTASFRIQKGTLSTPEILHTDRIISYVTQIQGRPLLSWQPVANAEQYEIIVSTDSDGIGNRETIRTGFTFLRMNTPLKQGTYYVQVRALSGESKSPFSEQEKIVISPVHPIQIISPTSADTIAPTDGTIRFIWEDQNQGTLYRVVLSKDSHFDKIFAEIETNIPTLEYEIPEKLENIFFWKVQLLTSDKIAFTETNIGIVRLHPMLNLIKPIFPINGEQIDINKNATISFRWEPVKNADNYVLSLYRVSGGLKSRVNSWTTPKTEFILNNFIGLSIDKYAWEITAQSGNSSQDYGTSKTVTSFFAIVQNGSLPVPKKIKITSWEEF